MELNSREFSDGRGKYAYIPGKLIKSTNNKADFHWEIISAEVNLPNSENVNSWGSSLNLDEYHQNLLCSENDSELLLGFCSVLNHLKSARSFIKSGDIGRALFELMKIRYIGMSFASKIVMFMNPSIAAVYDSVISERLKKYPELKYLYVKVIGTTEKEKTRQCEIYSKWCEFCANTAQKQNACGDIWIDWDSKKNNYRAVDIERAFFALGR